MFLFSLSPKRFFGKSDPFVRLKGLVGDSYLWGATKTVRDTLAPTWNESFAIDLLAKMPMGGKLAPFVVRVLSPILLRTRVCSCDGILQYFCLTSCVPDCFVDLFISIECFHVHPLTNIILSLPFPRPISTPSLTSAGMLGRGRQEPEFFGHRPPRQRHSALGQAVG